MASLKFVAIAAFLSAVIVLATVSVWFIYVMPNINVSTPINVNVVAETPEGEIIPATGKQYFYEHGGKLTINNDGYKTYDDSSVTTALPTRKFFHANKQSLMMSLGYATTSGSGDLWISDNGILYLVIDMNGTTYYLDEYETLNFGGDYIAERIDAFDYDPVDGDYDDDGTIEYYYKCDFTSVPKSDNNEATVYQNLYLINYDSAPSITSQANVTGVSATTDNYYTAEGYIAGWTGEGYGFKLSRVYITMGTATDNRTRVEDGYVKFVSLSVGDYTYTSAGWDYGSGWWKMNNVITSSDPAADPTEEAYCPMVYYDRGAGTTWAKVNFKIYGHLSSSDVFLVTIKIYYINPAGTVATATQNYSFTQS
jgi:hypothetical protein